MSQNENQILEFPTKKSLRVRMMNQSAEKKSILSISLASVFLVTLVMNEWIKNVQQIQKEGSARGVASLELKDFKKEYDWEQKWAKELAVQEADQSSKVASKPNDRDNLVYGVLEGKYSANFQKGQLISLEFNGSDSAPSLKPELFLSEYQRYLNSNSDHYRLLQKDGSKMTYEILSNKNQVLGLAEFDVNADGTIQSLVHKIK